MSRNKGGPVLNTIVWSLFCCFVFFVILFFLQGERDFEEQKEWTSFSLNGNNWTSFQFYSIYICCRVKTWSKNSLSLSQSLVQIFSVFSFFVFLIFFSLQGEWDFEEHEQTKDKKTHFFGVNTWSNSVAQHTWTKFWLNLGSSFDSTFLLTSGRFLPVWKKRRNHYCYSVSAKNEILSPPQKIEEHYWTQLRQLISFCPFFFCIFAFWGFCSVRFFGGLFFWEEWKTKKAKFKKKQQTQKRKNDHKMQTRRPLSLVTRNNTETT